jgi:hypothetical protein
MLRPGNSSRGNDSGLGCARWLQSPSASGVRALLRTTPYPRSTLRQLTSESAGVSASRTFSFQSNVQGPRLCAKAMDIGRPDHPDSRSRPTSRASSDFLEEPIRSVEIMQAAVTDGWQHLNPDRIHERLCRHIRACRPVRDNAAESASRVASLQAGAWVQKS